MACLLGETAVIERLHAAGMVAKTTSAAEFKMRVAGDVAKWASVIADANMERISSVDGMEIKFRGRPNAIVLAMFGPRRR